MKPLLSPKIDFVFRILFTRDVEILKDLLNNVLGLKGGDRIATVEVKNPEILPGEIEKKFIVLDVRAVDDFGREHDVEMQVRKYENYPKRTLYYLCKMYGNQLKAGQDYLDLHPVVGIHFLDYSPFPDSDADDFHFYQNPMVRRAYDGLKALSADEKTRELAERREKALKDEVSFLNEARREGKKEGKMETALRFLKMSPLTLEQIAEVAGLDAQEVEQLKRSDNFGSA